VNSNDIYLFLWNWVNLIVNTEGGECLEIIKSHENAPAPDFPYIAIQYAPTNQEKIGRATKTETDDEGFTKVISDYEATIEIWEEGGTGDRLRSLLDSIERSDIQDMFMENQIVFFNDNPIQIVPRLDKNEWINEALVEIRLRFATKTLENSGWIETIEYTGQIGDQTIEN
jgi:hypothetical protein